VIAFVPILSPVILPIVKRKEETVQELDASTMSNRELLVAILDGFDRGCVAVFLKTVEGKDITLRRDSIDGLRDALKAMDQ
jgi:hypothetical protein